MTSVAGRLARQNERAEGVGTNENAVKFCNQDYATLKSQCLQRGRLFEDDAFPASSRSLGFKELGPLSPKTRGVVWKRPKELCPKPYFIDNGATRTDICQGELGDCWLLAAIASLTLDDEILARVVPPGQDFDQDYAGIFHFQFWQFGDWIDVVIDDRLPTRDGKLLFVHSSEGAEFWSALLEKAYAKLNGCYEALSGGTTTEGFEDFTGGISEGYELNKAPPHLFKIIKKALGLGSLLGCSIDITSAYETEAVTALKLVKGHAYSLTGAEEVHYQGSTVELVRLRNPWGEVEWTGPWSDSSEEWNRILPEEKAKLANAAEDGEFWMAYSDFIKQFSTLEICNLTPDTLTSDEVAYWSYYQFNGQWRVGSTAGGCRNHPATFCSNPQYAIKLEHLDDDPLDGKHGCTLLVGLMQKDGRKDRRFGEDLNTIGFAIYKVWHLLYQAVAMSRTFINTREICDRFHLPPGEYVIIPSTFQPHKRGSFLLRVFTEKEANARVQYYGKVRYGVWTANCKYKDGNPRLSLMEFHVLWLKIQKYLKIFENVDLDNSGTMSTHEMRGALAQAGFQVNDAVLQVVVSRYASPDFSINFDNYVSCLIRLEMLYSESSTQTPRGFFQCSPSILNAFMNNVLFYLVLGRNVQHSEKQ
uniref:Calpain-2 catalytic subunit-like n=1 Tax=Scleropages formosus TaxID=113540 RepID=A0A8C9T3A1_SCLFO